MRLHIRVCWIGLLVLLLASTAMAGEFMDTWLTFAFSDDNIFADAEDRSPRPGFHYTGNEAFFDNYNSAYTGYETLAHLVLYKKMQSYFRHLELEAALVIQLENVTDEVTWDTETQLRDDGSYIKLNYYFDAEKMQGDLLALTLFPIDSDRFRLGYSYDITWGGNATWPTNTNPVPGMRLQYDFGTAPSATFGGYVLGGVKAARLLNEEINEVDTYYGYLFGMGLDFGKKLLWEMNGGVFEKGVFPPQSIDSDVGGEVIDAHGVSTRLTYRDGLPIGDSVDFRLYKNDLAAVRKAAEPEQYDQGLSYMISTEATYREQMMLDWDDPDTTLYYPAMAGDLNVKFKFGHLRLFGDVVYRQLAYILFDVPGLAPFYAFPDDAEITDEYFTAGGFDYNFPDWHLTLGLIGGYKHPATYKGATDIPDAADEQNVIVVRDLGDLEILPKGEEAYDIVTVKPNVKLELADGFNLLGEVQYTIDKNRTKYVDDARGVATREFEDETVTNPIGFSLLMQARF
ncbi:MAG TPA: hypothetical protein PKW95_06215 [bacterium]|nr:hypothetical protein [bacterium]